MNNRYPWKDPVFSEFDINVYEDKYPVTPGHLLFVPQFNSSVTIVEAFNSAYRHGCAKVISKEWDGFNIGMNYGEAAGQTVSWPHIHLIPRHKGDQADPTGGVRNIFPGKGNYHK